MAFDFGRRMIGIGAAATMLAGCASQPPIGAPGAMPVTNGAPDSLPYHKTFKFTGADQTFRVPAGVNSLTVVARGAEGGGKSESSGDYFGHGGRVFAVIPVRPDEMLHVFVGGQGSGISGGFNGGASGGKAGGGGSTFANGFGGGGASDVREHGVRLKDRILVAAGGGGESDYPPDGYGGKGGGKVGGAGGSYPSGYNGGFGTGGTQSQGGSGGVGGMGSSSENGANGSSGSFGRGGSGGEGARNPSGYDGGGGGGGGGGYYGGGGGGGGGASFGSIYGGIGGGGGGGCSYIEPSATRARTWGGWKTADGNGLVVFSWQ
jgi:hypothetical protein